VATDKNGQQFFGKEAGRMKRLLVICLVVILAFSFSIPSVFASGQQAKLAASDGATQYSHDLSLRSR
jgi:hypothetical protein